MTFRDAPMFRFFGPRPEDHSIMARSATLALVLSAILAIADAQVTVLNGENFDANVVNGGKNAIVKFYAPWYDHTPRSRFASSNVCSSADPRPPLPPSSSSSFVLHPLANASRDCITDAAHRA